MGKKKKMNYLDLVPEIGTGVSWERGEDGVITLHVKNYGFFPFIAQLMFNRPKVRHVLLEGPGNCIWPLIDGKNTVYDIALAVRKRYGAEAEPLFERVVQYFGVLEGNGLVRCMVR